MILYNCPRNSRVKILDSKYPVGSRDPEGKELTFHKIDGMYSLCTDDQGNIYHPVAWSEVEIVETRKSVPTNPPILQQPGTFRGETGIHKPDERG